MLTLAFDTATAVATSALVDDGEVLGERVSRAQTLLEDVDALLRQGGANARDLDALAVGIGPGSFTGVRIAISYAKALALGWNVPLCGVSTFDALECGIDAAGRPLLTVVRGREGVISVRLRTGSAERRTSGYIRDVLETLQPALPPALVLTGNGAEDVRAPLGERGTEVTILPHAIEPAALAVAMLAAQREPAKSLHEVRADYGELPAVTVYKK